MMIYVSEVMKQQLWVYHGTYLRAFLGLILLSYSLCMCDFVEFSQFNLCFLFSKALSAECDKSIENNTVINQNKISK